MEEKNTESVVIEANEESNIILSFTIFGYSETAVIVLKIIKKDGNE